ncbi:MAG: replication-associated recombination protein A [bacterium]
MRPQTLEEFVGQEELMAAGKPLRRLLEKGKIHSAIFWGPPGSGKTTLAHLIAHLLDLKFIFFSAVTSGIKQIKEVMVRAEQEQTIYGRSTILFVDEIHRFNKAQQDAFLPYVESGHIILLGATTENPSFEVVGALLSRLKVYLLEPLSPDAVDAIITRALSDAERGLGEKEVAIDKEAREFIIQTAAGDARRALTLLELACEADPEWDEGRAQLTFEKVKEVAQKKVMLYDKSGEEHYNLISALHKSLRDSDPDAALYWLARMLASGEEPLYLARRLVRFAVEDVGLADPNALNVALNARETYHQLGSPEGELALVMVTVYLAAAPKSNSLYSAYRSVQKTIAEEPAYPVPLHIRNAPTGLMKSFGYGEGYQYAHDFENAITGQSDLPEQLQQRKFYHPTDRGIEKRIAERLEYWESLRTAARQDSKKRDK